MVLVSPWFVLSAFTAVQGKLAVNASSDSQTALGPADATTALQLADIDHYEKGHTITPFDTRNGWVKPEDLAAMPQCIAQQDQSAWLSAMTRCTSRECTRHFVICMHHQWRIQPTCLSSAFSPELVSPYLPFCSRSVLAKAQLFHWILAATSRNWLVDVGDATGLQKMTPASLPKGYAAVGVMEKAPACLTESQTETSEEPFQHVMASCGFTSQAQHTGNAARPWEYREALHSMVALDFETAGYHLTQHRIADGEYFDRACFYKTFRTERQKQICHGQGFASTKARLWLNATCGPEFLPTDWENGLQTTTFAFIPTRTWRWPDSFVALPRKLILLAEQYTGDACSLDSDGYCRAERAVDRAQFCHRVDYLDCKGSCQIFEARIRYVEWLYEVCGSVEGWHGLPKHWRQLAAPTTVDMMPGQWRIEASKHLSGRNRHSRDSAYCASNDGKLGSIVLVNLATLLTAVYAQFPASAATNRYSSILQQGFVSSFTMAIVPLSSNWMNAILVQSMTGYDAVPIVPTILLWSTMPRLTWLSLPLVTLRSSPGTTMHKLASCIAAETFLQALSASAMIQTVSYGHKHSFYSAGMARLDAAPSAQYMYAGAAIWLVVTTASVVFLLQRARDAMTAADPPRRSRTAKPTSPHDVDRSKLPWVYLEDALSKHLVTRWQDKQSEPLLHDEARTYGTLPIPSTSERRAATRAARLVILATGIMFVLWCAQWLFWAGFIGLSSTEYCPPKLGLLTTVWIGASIAVALVAMAPGGQQAGGGKHQV